MGRICIPRGASDVMTVLALDGFDSYVVGGCVRDSLLGLEPHDWDICTNATPNEVLETFARRNVKIIETGIKHGTVTVCLDGAGEQYEITTFRIDGKYSDGRHPDSVSFTPNLLEDLARRDFTMNAMAYNEVAGLIDPFGGEKALRRNEISCVGNPADRFQEDALRVMRALRFASTYGFSVEANTAAAVHQFAPHLNDIAVERIQAELCKLLLGKGVLEVLLDYGDVIAAIIPEISPCIGFDQKNRYHEYTIYDHIAHAVANYTGDDISIKVALLLHDIGKPQCYTEDERGGHFHGHSVPSHDIADIVTKRLRFDNKTRDEVLTLVLYHDSVIEPTYNVVRRWLNKIGEENFRKLLYVRMADIKAHAKGTQESRIKRCTALHGILEVVLEQEQCFSMKDLAIRGKDVMSLGVPEGKIVGDTLQHILDMVINGEIPNEIEAQMDVVKQYLMEHQHEWKK